MGRRASIHSTVLSASPGIEKGGSVADGGAKSSAVDGHLEHHSSRHPCSLNDASASLAQLHFTNFHACRRFRALINRIICFIVYPRIEIARSLDIMGAAGLLVHSMAMLVVPLVVFAYARAGSLDSLILKFVSPPLSDASRLLAAGVCAVVSVNLVLVTFIVSAALEKAPAVEEKKKQ